MRVPAGLLYTGARSRKLMAGSLVLSTVTSVFYPLAIHPLSFALVRCLHGIGFSIATTVNMALFVESMPDKGDRGRAAGRYAGGMAFGYMLGSFIAGFSADLLGFQGAFLVLAFLWLLALAPVLLVEPGLARPVRGLAARTGPSKSTRQILSALTDPGVAGAVLGSFYLSILQAVYSAFTPLLFVAQGLSLSQIGVIRGTFAMVNAFGRPLAGTFMSGLGYRRLQSFGLAVQALFLIFFFLPYGFVFYLGISVASAIGRAVGYVANTVALAEDIDPSRISRGVASGIMNASRDAGSILGPLLGGVIVQVVGIEMLWLVAPPLLIASHFALLWLVRRRKAMEG